MDINEKIIIAIEKVTGIGDINLDVPEREEFGDYSTNIAMAMYSNLQLSISNLQENSNSQIYKLTGLELKDVKSPRLLAEAIVEQLKNDKELMWYIEKIEVAGPGFINFYLKTEVILDNLKDILEQGERYGTSEEGRGKVMVIDYSASPL